MFERRTQSDKLDYKHDARLCYRSEGRKPAEHHAREEMEDRKLGRGLQLTNRERGNAGFMRMLGKYRAPELRFGRGGSDCSYPRRLKVSNAVVTL